MYLEKSLNQWILLVNCLPMRHLNQMSLEMCIKKADLPVKCACYFPEVKLQLVTIVQQSHCHCLENVFWRMNVFNHFSFLVHVVFHSMFSAQTTVSKSTSREALRCELVNQIKLLSIAFWSQRTMGKCRTQSFYELIFWLNFFAFCYLRQKYE